MREIKFRAWCERDNRMIFDFEKEPLGGYLDDVGRLIRYNTWTFMQSTGLKDKNGKEIYEGDIISEWRESRSFPKGRAIIHEIKWDEDMTLDDSYGMTAVGFCLFGGELEVIGNIYENPDLLSDNKK